jgi:uncharacterized protein with HEPN domain
MQPETRKRLDDMLGAADAIGRFVAGKTMADYLADELLRAGVYHEFSIIGEALSQIRKSEPDVAERISEYDRIIGFRNQIIHG